MRKAAADDATAREIPPGVSRAMLHELHLLTRDGALNADARRKLKQIRHLVGLIEPAVRDVLDRQPSPILVDCGAGKSYLGFLLYDMLLAGAGRGELIAIEHRAELTAAAAARAAKFGYDRLRFLATTIGATDAAPATPSTPDTPALPERLHLVTALHACDTATDDAIALGVRRQADHIIVVPCCQAEVARQLGAAGRRDRGPSAELYRHAWHRREFGSHLTNVVRALALEAAGYQVTVTELTGWEHSMKNEVILARRVHRDNREARARLRALLTEFAIEPALIRLLPTVGSPTETT